MNCAEKMKNNVKSEFYFGMVSTECMFLRHLTCELTVIVSKAHT